MTLPVMSIGVRRIYAEPDIQVVAKTVYNLTERASISVDRLMKRLETQPQMNETEIQSIEAEINTIIQAWQSKIEKLGGEPRGLWFADFDSGDGYYCWRFPEQGIQYWHSYEDGFSKRVPLLEKNSKKSLADRFRQTFLHP